MQRLALIVDIHPSPDLIASGFYAEYRAQVLEALAKQLEALPAYAQRFILDSGYRFGFGDDPKYIESQTGVSLASQGAVGAHSSREQSITNMLSTRQYGYNLDTGAPILEIDDSGIRDAINTALHETGHGLDAQIARQHGNGRFFSPDNFLTPEQRSQDLDVGMAAIARHTEIDPATLSSPHMRTELDRLIILSENAVMHELYQGLPKEVAESACIGGLPLFHAMGGGYVVDAHGKPAYRLEDIHLPSSRHNEAVEATAEMFRHYLALKEAGLDDAEIQKRFLKVSPNLWQWFSTEVLPHAEKLDITPRSLDEIKQQQKDAYVRMAEREAVEHGTDATAAREKAIAETASLSPSEMAERFDMLRAKRMKGLGPYYVARKTDVPILEAYFRQHHIQGDAGTYYDTLQRSLGYGVNFHFEDFVKQTEILPIHYAITHPRSGDFEIAARLIYAKYGFDMHAPMNAADRLACHAMLVYENQTFIAHMQAMRPPPTNAKSIFPAYAEQQIAAAQPHAPVSPEHPPVSQEKPAAAPAEPAPPHEASKPAPHAAAATEMAEEVAHLPPSQARAATRMLALAGKVLKISAKLLPGAGLAVAIVAVDSKVAAATEAAQRGELTPEQLAAVNQAAGVKVLGGLGGFISGPAADLIALAMLQEAKVPSAFYFEDTEASGQRLHSKEAVQLLASLPGDGSGLFLRDPQLRELATLKEKHIQPYIDKLQRGQPLTDEDIARLNQASEQALNGIGGIQRRAAAEGISSHQLEERLTDDMANARRIQRRVDGEDPPPPPAPKPEGPTVALDASAAQKAAELGKALAQSDGVARPQGRQQQQAHVGVS